MDIFLSSSYGRRFFQDIPIVMETFAFPISLIALIGRLRAIELAKDTCWWKRVPSMRSPVQLYIGELCTQTICVSDDIGVWINYNDDEKSLGEEKMVRWLLLVGCCLVGDPSPPDFSPSRLKFLIKTPSDARYFSSILDLFVFVVVIHHHLALYLLSIVHLSAATDNDGYTFPGTNASRRVVDRGLWRTGVLAFLVLRPAKFYSKVHAKSLRLQSLHLECW